jgi:hypothetical protein
MGICDQLYLPADIKEKLAAEMDEHPMSRDWDERGGPRGQQCYGWVMKRLVSGEEVWRSEIDDQLRAHLSKVSPNEAILLEEDEFGSVHVFSDPEPLERDDEDRPSWPAYPGCPEAVNPKAGERMSADQGKRAALKAWKSMKGERASDRRICEWINTHREMLGLEGHRWMGTDNCGLIRRRLLERGAWS